MAGDGFGAMYQPAGGTLNSAVSTQLQTNFGLTHNKGAVVFVSRVGPDNRWAGVVLDHLDVKYRVYKRQLNPTVVDTDWVAFATLALACDNAAAFVDAENA